MDPENHETTPHKTPENDPGSAAIIPEDRYGQTLMPGLAPIRPNRLVDGEVTKGVREQVAALRELGVLRPVHHGTVALAITTAQEIDAETRSGGKAYGKAQLAATLNAVLENLPQAPETESEAFDKALRSIMDNA